MKDSIEMKWDMVQVRKVEALERIAASLEKYVRMSEEALESIRESRKKDADFADLIHKQLGVQ